MRKILLVLSILNTIYIIVNLFTYSDNLFNGPIGLTTLIAIVLLLFNNLLKIKSGVEEERLKKIINILCFGNLSIGALLIIFI